MKTTEERVQDATSQPADTTATSTGYITSSKCEASACVGVKLLPDGSVAVINTANSSSQPVVFSREEWVAFTEGVKENEFDLS